VFFFALFLHNCLWANKKLIPKYKAGFYAQLGQIAAYTFNGYFFQYKRKLHFGFRILQLANKTD